MDSWTTEAVALRADIRGVEATLGARIDDVGQRLTVRIDDFEQRLTTRIDAFEQRLTTRINETAHQLRTEIADSRRHTDVLFESLRDDIRLVAEGLAVVGAKLDRLTR